MKSVVIILALLAVASTATAAEPPPNIILCMADDLGWGDVGYNGHQRIKTPHIDELAENGLVFDRFYAAAPVCSPTRGSCLTGRHPSRYGIPTANAGHLRQKEICLAEVLRDLGYTTGHFGKWHLGTLTPNFSGKGQRRRPRENFMTPAMAGFDEWFSTEYAVATWDPYAPANAHGMADVRTLYWHNGRNVADGKAAGLTGCDSRIIMDRAVAFVESAADAGRPFFAVIWFHAPHQPVIGGPEYLTLYPDEPEDTRHYYAVVTALDAQIGRLRKQLRELDVADNTMLWFCSDNGPEGNPRPRGRSQGSAGPFRGRKRSLYEGGVRVPGIVEWPARIESHETTDVPAVTSDFVPTILEVLGYRLPDDQNRPFDGVSLLPLIDGEMTERPQPIGFASHGRAAWSDNRYKLVHNPTGERAGSDNGTTPVAEWELYDLLADPGEMRNLAEEAPEVVERMRKELLDWRSSCNASANGRDY